MARRDWAGIGLTGVLFKLPLLHPLGPVFHSFRIRTKLRKLQQKSKRAIELNGALLELCSLSSWPTVDSSWFHSWVSLGRFLTLLGLSHPLMRTFVAVLDK